MEEDFKLKIKNNYSKENYDLIIKAYEYAKCAHEGQKRVSGEDYIIHPMAVAEILVDLGLDFETIEAALLHDVLEDTPTTEQQLEKEFGKNVVVLVNGVTKLDKLQFKTKEEEQAENLRKMLLAMSEDLRIIIIKLADRLHNVRTLGYKNEASQQKTAKETLDIYAPIAARLGISNLKGELEDTCMKYLYKDEYYALVETISSKKVERQKFLETVTAEIYNKLEELGIKGDINGRPKHLYSIYKKMQSGKTFDQIYDLMAVRIIVESVKDCYAVLGAIHTMWKPLPGRFKDYIAMPKPSGYQSLHTTVITKYGSPFEIQIRTKEMHKIAEYGVAAHWKYKEGKLNNNDMIADKLKWLYEVMEVQKEAKDSKEFLDSLKMDLYTDEVFVFSPKGDVINLPSGATGVDFAYNVHSEVGNKCVGIKINSKMVPLNTVLETGNIVEVITSNASKGPSRDWLKFVKTNSAKSKIRNFYKKEMKDENIKRGKELLEREAKRRGYNLAELISNKKWFEYVKSRYSLANIEDVYASVGYGRFTTNQVLLRLIDYFKRDMQTGKKVIEIAEAQTQNVNNINKKSNSGVLIKGYDDFLIRLSQCCKPVPGDKIVGYVSRGRGVSIHRIDCPNMKNVENERIIEAEWPADITKKFIASLDIIAFNSGKLMLNISSVINSMKFNIVKLNMRADSETDTSIVNLGVEISNINDLEILITKLRMVEGIKDVYRSTK
ncbi:MAG: bifunctional (p)ppGpp synthetase/guanosine-3',5'-bis(diphosphate) 3'-pyrophosphohydrolase [Clostridia bacterium]